MDAFDEAVAAHDAAVAARGTSIWVGGEPTFTRRESFAAEWLGAASGDAKERDARALLAPLARALGPGGAVLRTLGRQYPDEERARFSYGIWARRDGAMVWDGPPDPAMRAATDAAAEESDAADDERPLARARALRDALAARLRDEPPPASDEGDASGHWRCLATTVDAPLPIRLAWHAPALALGEDDPRLARASLHADAIPDEGPSDALADEGALLFAFGAHGGDDAPGVVRVEMPAIASVAAFERVLAALAVAAREAALDALVIAGFPPPVDETIAWTSVTPDPGVVEINTAPAPDVATYLAWSRAIYAAAAEIGLAPERFHYNGQVADSGGGGHITLGGPDAATSPFFAKPHLLGALVRYMNRHPALSYLFAVDGVGSSGQAPRPDEGVRESFGELALALDRLAAVERPSPEAIWGGLAPFLADRAGNSHRAEINAEKLWNPHLPGRGKLGVIELRAFRMARTPERAAALAALVRAIACLLRDGRIPGERARGESGLVDWGAELHDRFALPFHLERDLAAVLADLEAGGLGLGAPIARALDGAGERELGEVVFDGARLRLRAAIEFWPLVGDTAGQDRGTSRWVDASTRRIEVTLRAESDAGPAALEPWRLATAGVRVPLKAERDADGAAVLVGGLRWRNFEPRPGLHPGLRPRGAVELALFRAGTGRVCRVELHEWIPGGGAYAGLPDDDGEAARRRAERFVTRVEDRAGDPPAAEPPPRAATAWCLDLRRLQTVASSDDEGPPRVG